MKILIREKGKQRKILVPTKMVLSGVLKRVGIENVKHGKEIVGQICRCLREYKGLYGSFIFIELQEREGEYIKIIF